MDRRKIHTTSGALYEISGTVVFIQPSQYGLNKRLPKKRSRRIEWLPMQQKLSGWRANYMNFIIRGIEWRLTLFSISSQHQSMVYVWFQIVVGQSAKQPHLTRVNRIHPLIGIIPPEKFHQFIKTNAP
jgi:hypothetical protein